MRGGYLEGCRMVLRFWGSIWRVLGFLVLLGGFRA